MKIHYNGVGIIREPTAEDMEEYRREFPEHLGALGEKGRRASASGQFAPAF